MSRRRSFLKTICSLVIIVGSVSLCLPTPVLAQASGVISGSVTDTDNRPLPGTRVTVVSGEDESVRQSVITDVKGRYEVGGLPRGTYQVTAELVGFTRDMKQQVVTSGRREVWMVLVPGALREQAPTASPVQILPLRKSID
jgi:hypothetical protein